MTQRTTGRHRVGNGCPVWGSAWETQILYDPESEKALL